MVTEQITIFENKITRERLICRNVNLVRYFDNVAFLSVHRENETRQFLIRRDALDQIS
jgi:hypothetical protein